MNKDESLSGCFWGLVVLFIATLAIVWIVVRTVALAWRG